MAVCIGGGCRTGLSDGTEDVSRPNGAACIEADECATGFCADNVCCDLPCSSTCYACTAAKKGSGDDGTCGPIALQTDPDAECNGGRCDGRGGCRFDNGGPCTSTAHCFSNECVDGYCCESSCNGICQSCSAEKKGSGDDGTCGPIVANADPDGECGLTCDGAGMCAGAANGVACNSAAECASGHCADGVCCNNICAGSCLACDVPTAMGTCTAQCPNTCAGTVGFPEAPLTPLPIVGNAFVSAASGDFNGDGKADFVALDSFAKVASVFMNQAGGTFAPKVDYPAGPSPDVIAAKDLNGDGRPDLVMLDTALDTVGVYLNQGNGAFAARVDYATGVQVGDWPMDASVSVDDLNADGFPDLVIDGIAVLTNRGNGTFVTKTDHGLAKSGWVCTGDLNGDGSPDIVVVDGSQIHVSYNNGNATFTPATMYWLNGTGARCALADLNGDAKLDLVVLDEDNAHYFVLLNDGSGGFSAAVVYSTNFVESSLEAHWFDLADFNRDGKLDLTITKQENQSVTVAFGNGDGTFGPLTPYPTRGWVHAAAIADFTADGNPDIVAVNGSSTKLFVNQGNGVFEVPGQSYEVTGSPVIGKMADFDNDGKLDIAIGSGTFRDSGMMTVLFDRGNGSFGGRTDYSLDWGTIGVLSTADLTGDGKPEIIAASLVTLSVFRNQGNGTFAAPVEYAVEFGPYAIAAADFTGDGQNDLVVASHKSSYDFSLGSSDPLPSENKLSTYVNLGNGDLGSPIVVDKGGRYNSLGYANDSGLVATDFTGDGIMDLIWAYADQASIRFLTGQGNGGFTDGVSYSVPGSPYSLHLLDMNNDALSDLVTTRDHGTVSVLFNQGGGAFGNPIDQTGLFGTRSLSIADINGDGLVDFVGANSSDHTVGVALNQGGTFGTPLKYASGGVEPHDVIAHDMNTDGKLDLLVVNRQSSALTVLLNTCLP